MGEASKSHFDSRRKLSDESLKSEGAQEVDGVLKVTDKQYEQLGNGPEAVIAVEKAASRHEMLDNQVRFLKEKVKKLWDEYVDLKNSGTKIKVHPVADKLYSTANVADHELANNIVGWLNNINNRLTKWFDASDGPGYVRGERAGKAAELLVDLQASLDHLRESIEKSSLEPDEKKEVVDYLREIVSRLAQIDVVEKEIEDLQERIENTFNMHNK